MPHADLTDTRMHYETKGSGPALVFVPGLGATNRMWGPVTDVLAADFCLVLPDNREIGQSTARRPARNVRHYAADLVDAECLLSSH